MLCKGGDYTVPNIVKSKSSSLGPDLHKSGIVLEVLGRGPRAFLIGKISDVNPEFGKISEHSKLIFSKLT